MILSYALGMRILKHLTLALALILSGVLSASTIELMPDRDLSTIEAEMSASPPHTFTGIVRDYSLDLEVDSESGRLSVANFRFNFADFDTDNSKRDRKMLRWLDHVSWPDAQFTLIRVDETGEGLVAVGEFTMHGLTKTVEIPFSMTRKSGRFTLDATTTLDHRDWELPKVRLLIFTVNPVLEIRIHLEGSYADA